MLNLRHLTPLLFAGSLCAWVPMGLPVAHAAGPSGQPATSAGGLQKQELDLRKYLADHPDDAAAHLKLGHIYLNEAKFAAAETEANSAHRDSRYSDAADALLAWSLLLVGQDDRLLREVKPGDRDPVSESEVRMSRGLALMYLASIGSAEPMLRDAVRLDPSSWRAHMALARYLILRRDLSEARGELVAARAAAGSDEVGIERISAELDHAAGDTQKSIDEYTEVIKRHPSGLPARAGLIDALISLDKLAEAQKDADDAIRLNRNSQILFLDGLVLAREGKFDEAGAPLLRASTAFGNMPIGYYLYGVVKYWLGEPNTADDYLARFQGRQPNVSGVARLRAEIALQRKDPSAAIAALKPLVAANPADWEAAGMLARAYLSNGQPEQVISMYQQLASTPSDKKFAPVDPTGLLMMYGDAGPDVIEIEKIVMRHAPEVVVPMAALRQGDVAKASDTAESLAKAKPNDPWVQNLLGSVRVAQHRLTDAEAVFRGILAKRPDFAPAAFNLVGVLVAEKRLDDARAMLKDLAQRKLDDTTI